MSFTSEEIESHLIEETHAYQTPYNRLEDYLYNLKIATRERLRRYRKDPAFLEKQRVYMRAYRKRKVEQ